MPRLQVLNGKRQGAVFDMEFGTEHMIGHRHTAQITIDDPWVSWDHARLYFDRDGTCWIEDLNSTNGTYVNCVRVTREQLKHEDIIFLGKTHVILLAPAEERARSGLAPVVGNGASGPEPLFVASSSGPFNAEDSVLPTLRTPTLPLGVQRPGGGGKDPFEDSGVDAFGGSGEHDGFAVGSDAFELKDDDDEAETATRGELQMAETSEDLPRPRELEPARSLSLSDLQQDAELGRMKGPSSAEISRLIEGGGSVDDLNEILGDGRALTPEPQRIDARPSEMRTRQLIDAEQVQRTLSEVERAQQQRVGGGESTFPEVPQVPPQVAEGGMGALAFENSRLTHEVRRLRIAVEAARREHPEAVRAAVDQLKDDAMARLAKTIAELERDLASAKEELGSTREELDARVSELDEVTEDMIEKEDRIEELEDEVEDLRGQLEERV